MLSEEVRQMLAAYVDGEVSPRQRKHLDRLLRQSAEARDLLEQLQRDSGELRALRRQKLPREFSQHVLRHIAEMKLKPSARPPAPRPFPTWLGISVAAAVLLAVTGASFLFFFTRNRPPETQNQPEAAPIPLAQQPLLSLPNLDLNADDAGKLGEALAKGEAPRLHLVCQDPAAAVERLEAALKARGIRLMVPASTKAALNREAKVRLFVENVTAAELTALLQKLGSDDRQARAEGGRGAGFGRLVIHPMAQADRQELALAMGIDVKQLHPGALDLLNPIQVAKSQPAEQRKGKVRPFAAKKTPQQPERFALVLAWAGGAGDAASSPEVREFLRRRGPVRPGTLQVIIEIQPALG